MKDYDPNELVTCPYCAPPRTHKIRFKRLNVHLTDMIKQDPSLARMKRCKFNALHVVHETELTTHEFNCPDGVRHVEVKEAVHTFEDIIHHDVPSEESWDSPSIEVGRFKFRNDPARPLLSKRNDSAQGITNNKIYMPVGMERLSIKDLNCNKNETNVKNVNQVRKVTEVKAFSLKNLNFKADKQIKIQ